MLGSSCPEVFGKKVTIQSFAKFTETFFHLFQRLFLIKLQDICNFVDKETPAQIFSYEFSEIFRVNRFAWHMWMTTSKCSLLSNVIYMFSDFSEKKRLNSRSKRKTCTSVLLKILLCSLLFFKDILDKALLIFTFTIFLANSLQTPKIDFIMYVSCKLLPNAQRINRR